MRATKRGQETIPARIEELLAVGGSQLRAVPSELRLQDEHGAHFLLVVDIDPIGVGHLLIAIETAAP